MENTPHADLYKWDQTDEKQKTIIEMANNSQKIDAMLNKQDEQLKTIDSTLVIVDERINNTNSLIQKSTADAAISVDVSNKSDVKATEALETSNVAKTTAEEVQSQFNQVIAEAGSSNPEVVLARGGEVTLNARLEKTAAQLADSIHQTQTLSHGTHTIEAGVTSSLKIEIYGETFGNDLINLIGKIGNFEVDSNGDGIADGWKKDNNYGSYSLVQVESQYGNKAQRLTALSGDASINRYIYPEQSIPLKAGKYYVALVDLTTDGSQLGRFSFEGVNTESTQSKLLYVKTNPITDKNASISIINRGVVGSTGWVQFDGFRIYEVDQITYNQIGVSLSVSKIAEMFPYVESSKHVKNPYVLSSNGKNLYAEVTLGKIGVDRDRLYSENGKWYIEKFVDTKSEPPVLLSSPQIIDVSNKVDGSIVIDGEISIQIGSGFSYTETNGKLEYILTPVNKRSLETVDIKEVKITFSNNIRSTLDDSVEKVANVELNVNEQKRINAKYLRHYGLDVRQAPYFAKGNANYFNSADGKWYEDAACTIQAQDDTLAIQQAINENGEVFVPNGNYLVTNIVISNSYTEITGAGSRSNFVFNNPTGSGIILNNMANACSIEKIKISGDVDTGIEVNRSYGNTFRDIHFISCKTYGIKTIFSWGNHYERIHFMNMTTKPSEACLYFRYSAHTHTITSLYTNGISQLTKYCIHIAPNNTGETDYNYCHAIKITDSTIQGFGKIGIYAESALALKISGIYFESNHVDIQLGSNDLNAISGHVRGCNIDACRFYSIDLKPPVIVKNASGVSITGSAFPSGNSPIVVTNNLTKGFVFEGNTDWGGDPQPLFNRFRVEVAGQMPQVKIVDQAYILIGTISSGKQTVQRFMVHPDGTNLATALLYVDKYQFPTYIPV